MRKIQQEENDWSRDQEVLKNYKEGLEKEIADLKEQIADAKTRKAGADQESLEQVEPARPLSPPPRTSLSGSRPQAGGGPRRKAALVSRAAAGRAESRPGHRGSQARSRAAREKRNEGVSKRLLNVINLLTRGREVPTDRPPPRRSCTRTPTAASST